MFDEVFMNPYFFVRVRGYVLFKQRRGKLKFKLGLRVGDLRFSF